MMRHEQSSYSMTTLGVHVQERPTEGLNESIDVVSRHVPHMTTQCATHRAMDRRSHQDPSTNTRF